MGYLDNLSNDLPESVIQARQTLEKKRLAAIEYLGEKYVLHPKHNPTNNGAVGSVVSMYKHNVVAERLSLG